MPNIYDVARKANVSIAAVSLVVNDPQTPRVSEKKRKLIMATVKEIGYVPNRVARALTEGRTRIIGLVLPMREPASLNYFIADVIFGIQSAISQDHYHLMLYSHSSSTGRMTREELAQSRYVDGILVLNTRFCTAADMDITIHALNQETIPFVMINGYNGPSPINYAGVDDERTGGIGIEYLASKGHRRIAILGAMRNSPITQAFVTGSRQSLRAHGLPTDSSLVGYCNYEGTLTSRIVAKWLSAIPRPTAIFCVDDVIAPAVFEEVRRAGLVVGKDVAVLGRGNSILAGTLKPELSTMSIPGFDLGASAATLLLRCLHENKSMQQRIILAPTLALRDSA